MKIKPWMGVVGALVVAGGIGAMLPKDTTPEPTATRPTQQAHPASQCIAVSDSFAQQIIGEHKLVKASAVKADSGNYFVAIEFLPPDGKSATGVWQSLTLDAGPFRSVDGFAKNYTRWPDSGNAGAAIVDEAKGCLK